MAGTQGHKLRSKLTFQAVECPTLLIWIQKVDTVKFTADLHLGTQKEIKFLKLQNLNPNCCFPKLKILSQMVLMKSIYV